MGAVTSDYGGNQWTKGRRSGKVTRVRKDTCRSFRCDDCGHLNYIPYHVLERSSLPHCSECGGLLIETEASRKRHDATATTKREFDVATEAAKPFQCRECKKRFRNESALNLHIRDNHMNEDLKHDRYVTD